ncbi:MAG: hypothetical protein FJ303_07860 [Planctomycetes bacterium]|nr:hypothetical protein [Planctomycetota bacterium]
MSGEAFREFLKAQPFVPFEIQMSSGDMYHVTQSENVFLTGAALFIWFPEDRVVRCSLMHITGYEFVNRPVKRKGGKS